MFALILIIFSGIAVRGHTGPSVQCGDCGNCDCSPLANHIDYLNDEIVDKLDDVKRACDHDKNCKIVHVHDDDDDDDSKNTCKKDRRYSPNVIVILVDDMAYAQLGRHGDPFIQAVRLPNRTEDGGTKYLDALYDESVRMTDFHSGPICTATRSALMTGRYPLRTNGITQFGSREHLFLGEKTMAEVFKANGYHTYHNGKWDLGNLPGFEPFERGFDETFGMKAATGNQPSNGWNFDFLYEYVLFRNGAPERYTGDIDGNGYLTRTLMDDAIRFIDDKKDDECPFFMYVASIVPHWPIRVPPAYRDAYKAIGLPGHDDLSAPQSGTNVIDANQFGTLAEMYAGVSIIDEEVGRLRAHLEATGIADDTLLVFTTDNGVDSRMVTDDVPCPDDVPSGYVDFVTPIAPSANGTGQFGSYYDAGLFGTKDTAYEGGHRAASFWHWPNGGLVGGHDSATLGNVMDVLPTFIDLANLDNDITLPLDGVSLAANLQTPSHVTYGVTWFTEGQVINNPVSGRRAVAMRNDNATHHWRLLSVSGSPNPVPLTRLYNLVDDPSQQNNTFSLFPDIAAGLQAEYDAYFAETTAELAARDTERYVPLGRDFKQVTLTAYTMDGDPPSISSSWIWQNVIDVFFGRIPSYANEDLGEVFMDLANRPAANAPIRANLSCSIQQTIDRQGASPPQTLRDDGHYVRVNFVETGCYEFKMRRFPVERPMTPLFNDSAPGPSPNSPEYKDWLRPYNDATPLGFGAHYSKAVVELVDYPALRYEEPIIAGTTEVTVHTTMTIGGPVLIRFTLERTGNDLYNPSNPLTNRDAPLIYVRRVA